MENIWRELMHMLELVPGEILEAGFPATPDGLVEAGHRMIRTVKLGKEVIAYAKTYSDSSGKLYVSNSELRKNVWAMEA